jgi:hypothetical protein
MLSTLMTVMAIAPLLGPILSRCRLLYGRRPAPLHLNNQHRENNSPWTSKETAHSLPAKDPPSGLPAPVRVDPLFEAPVPARAFGASVTFEPDARTAWHTHPLGQTLIVTAGCGRVQRLGWPNRGNSPG